MCLGETDRIPHTTQTSMLTFFHRITLRSFKLSKFITNMSLLCRMTRKQDWNLFLSPDVSWYNRLWLTRLKVPTGGGGGFFLACENLERTFDHSWTACAFFSFSFFEVEVSLRTIIPHFNARISPQWLSWPRWLWLNVPHKLRVSSFLDRFPHYAWTAA